MNLILVRAQELAPGNLVTVGDEHARHILRVLKAGPGATVRVGLLDGPLGTATVVRAEGERVVLGCVFGEERPAPPRVDLLLALPRPKVLARLWSQLAAWGWGGSSSRTPQGSSAAISTATCSRPRPTPRG